MDTGMIPETENPQKAKCVYPGKPARHASTDPDQYLTSILLDFLAGRLICK